MRLSNIDRQHVMACLTFNIALTTCCVPGTGFGQSTTGEPVTRVVQRTLQNMVKVNGSGGFRRLENYQTGCCISDNGEILTAWSTVLDSSTLSVTLANGQKFPARLLGYDPGTEIAVLKIDAPTANYFDLQSARALQPGTTILAVSNLFGVAVGDEPMSVQRGIIASRTRLSSQSGGRDTVYQGEVYLLDAVTNNPGTAGGAITDRDGSLVAMIGKEIRSSETGTWMNYALPIEQIADAIESIRAGRQRTVSESDAAALPPEPLTVEMLGIVLVPDVVDRTPPYIDRVVGNSVADREGLLADDLIIALNDELTPSIQHLNTRIRQIDRSAGLTLTIRRDQAFRSFNLRLSPKSPPR